MPIIEPEVDIHCENKSEAEQMLFENLKNQIEKLNSRTENSAEINHSKRGQFICTFH